MPADLNYLLQARRNRYAQPAGGTARASSEDPRTAVEEEAFQAESKRLKEAAKEQAAAAEDAAKAYESGRKAAEKEALRARNNEMEAKARREKRPIYTDADGRIQSQYTDEEWEAKKKLKAKNDQLRTQYFKENRPWVEDAEGNMIARHTDEEWNTLKAEKAAKEKAKLLDEQAKAYREQKGQALTNVDDQAAQVMRGLDLEGQDLTLKHKAKLDTVKKANNQIKVLEKEIEDGETEGGQILNAAELAKRTAARQALVAERDRVQAETDDAEAKLRAHEVRKLEYSKANNEVQGWLQKQKHGLKTEMPPVVMGVKGGEAEKEVPQKGAKTAAKKEETEAYGYPIKSAQEMGLDEYLKSHPDVAGMAWGGGENDSSPDEPRVIVVNPHNKYMSDPEKRGGLAKIEAARHKMSEVGYAPDFSISPEQQEWRKKLGPYATDDKAFKQSIVSRLLAHDDVPGVTEEQKKAADEFEAAHFGKGMKEQGNAGTGDRSQLQTGAPSKEEVVRKAVIEGRISALAEDDSLSDEERKAGLTRLMLQRDDPQAYEAGVMQEFEGMPPEKLNEALDGHLQDFEMRKQDWQARRDALRQQTQAVNAEVDTVLARNAQRLQQPHKAADLIEYTTGDGGKVSVFKDLVPQLEQAQEKAGTFEKQHQAEMDQINAEGGELERAAKLIHAGGGVLQKKHETAQVAAKAERQKVYDQLNAIPGAKLGDELAKVDEAVAKHQGGDDVSLHEWAKQEREKIIERAKAMPEQAKKFYEEWGKKLDYDWTDTHPEFSGVDTNMGIEAKKYGITDKEGARYWLITMSQADWSRPNNIGGKEIDPAKQDFRFLPNGNITVNPGYLLDKEGYEQVVKDSQATPEAKKQALEVRQQIAPELATQALEALRQNSDMKAWLDENTSGTDLQRMEQFTAKMKAGGWTTAALMRFQAAAAGIGASWTGAAGAVTGSDTFLQADVPSILSADWWKKRADVFSHAAGVAEKGTGVLGKYAAMVVGGLPSVLESVAAGAATGGLAKIGGLVRTAKGLQAAQMTGAAIDAGIQQGGSTFNDAYQHYLEQEIGKLGGEDMKDPTAEEVEQAKAEARAKALKPAILDAVQTGALTALGGAKGAEALLRTGTDQAVKKAFKTGLGKVLAGIGVDAGEEFLEEYANQFVSGVIAQASYNPQLTVKDVFSQALDAGIVGGLLGGGMGSVKAVGDYRNEWKMNVTGNELPKPEAGTEADRSVRAPLTAEQFMAEPVITPEAGAAPAAEVVPETPGQSQSPDQSQLATGAPSTKPTVEEARAELASFAPEGMAPHQVEATKAKAEVLLRMAQGETLADFTDEELRQVGLNRDGTPGHYETVLVDKKDPQGARTSVWKKGVRPDGFQPVVVEDGELIITQRQLDNLGKRLPAVAAQIGKSEVERRREIGAKGKVEGLKSQVSSSKTAEPEDGTGGGQESTAAETDQEYKAAKTTEDKARIIDAEASKKGLVKVYQGVAGGKVKGNKFSTKEIGLTGSDKSKQGYHFSTKKSVADNYARVAKGKTLEFFIDPRDAYVVEGTHNFHGSDAQAIFASGKKIILFKNVDDVHGVADNYMVAPGYEHLIKSANPIETDDAGKEIPPSRRFDPSTADIRGSSVSVETVAPETAKQVESRGQSKPEARATVETAAAFDPAVEQRVDEIGAELAGRGLSGEQALKAARGVVGRMGVMGPKYEVQMIDPAFEEAMKAEGFQRDPAKMTRWMARGQFKAETRGEKPVMRKAEEPEKRTETTERTERTPESQSQSQNAAGKSARITPLIERSDWKQAQGEVIGEMQARAKGLPEAGKKAAGEKIKAVVKRFNKLEELIDTKFGRLFEGVRIVPNGSLAGGGLAAQVTGYDAQGRATGVELVVDAATFAEAGGITDAELERALNEEWQHRADLMVMSRSEAIALARDIHAAQPGVFNAAWKQYYAVQIKDGSMPAKPPVELTDDEAYTLYFEASRMIRQGTFTSENAAIRDVGLLQRMYLMLSRYVNFVRREMKKLPQDLRELWEDKLTAAEAVMGKTKAAGIRLQKEHLDDVEPPERAQPKKAAKKEEVNEDEAALAMAADAEMDTQPERKGALRNPGENAIRGMAAIPDPDNGKENVVVWINRYHGRITRPSKGWLARMAQDGKDRSKIGDWDDIRQAEIPSFYAGLVFKNGNGSTLDQALQELHGLGYFPGVAAEDVTGEMLARKIKDVIGRYQAKKQGGATTLKDEEQAHFERMEKQRVEFERSTAKGPIYVKPHEMQPGDVMMVKADDGKMHRVEVLRLDSEPVPAGEEFDPDANPAQFMGADGPMEIRSVTLKDGTTFGVQTIDGQQGLYVDAFSVRQEGDFYAGLSDAVQNRRIDDADAVLHVMQHEGMDATTPFAQIVLAIQQNLRVPMRRAQKMLAQVMDTEANATVWTNEELKQALESPLGSPKKQAGPGLFGETFDMFAGDSQNRGLLEQAVGTKAAAAAFSLEAVSAKQLDDEMEKAARKAKLTAKQAAPLQGSAGEYGTQDLLDVTAGPMALFSQPIPQKGTLFSAPKQVLKRAQEDSKSQLPPVRPDLEDFLPPKGESRKGQFSSAMKQWRVAFDQWKAQFESWVSQQGKLGAFLAPPVKSAFGPMYQRANVVTPLNGGGWRMTVFGRYEPDGITPMSGDWADGAWVPIGHDEFSEKVPAYDAALSGMDGAEYTRQALFSAAKQVQQTGSLFGEDEMNFLGDRNTLGLGERKGKDNQTIRQSDGETAGAGGDQSRQDVGSPSPEPGFALEATTPQELKAEAERKVLREKLQARAEKPLVGTMGDIGQTQMFGGGDLFAQPGRPRGTLSSPRKQGDETGAQNTLKREQRTGIDDAAHEAATSPRNDLEEPTAAQKEAGNYKLGHAVIGGHEISIENPAGSKRRPEWPVLKDHYGYLKGTKGQDGDHVDVFVKPGTPADYAGPVHVVRQNVVENGKATGKLDEYKLLLGYETAEEARAAYLRNYTKGWPGLGKLTTHTMPEFEVIKRSVFGGDAGARATDKALASPRKQGQVTPEQDAEYLQAVKDGDVAKQQAMVDAAAKAAGYDSGTQWHGTDSKDFSAFEIGRKGYRGLLLSVDEVKSNGVFFSESEEDALGYGKNVRPFVLKTGNVWKSPDQFFSSSRMTDSQSAELNKAMNDAEFILAPSFYTEGDTTYIGMDNGISRTEIDPDGDWVKRVFIDGMVEWSNLDNPDVVSRMKQRGYDSVMAYEPNDQSGKSWFVTRPNQIKSADPITRDAKGNVIPLSQRFNAESDSILYAPRKQAKALEVMAKADWGRIDKALTGRLATAVTDAAGWIKKQALPGEAQVNPVDAALELLAGWSVEGQAAMGGVKLKPAQRQELMAQTRRQMRRFWNYGVRQIVPDASLPADVLAKKREMTMNQGLSNEVALDIGKRALAGKPKLSDLVVGEAQQNPEIRRKMFLAMNPKIDSGVTMESLNPEERRVAEALLKLRDDLGRRMVKAGRIGLQTFEAMREGTSHYYDHDVKKEKSLMRQMSLGLRNLFAQTATAWHIVDTQTKQPDGSPALVMHPGNMGRPTYRFDTQEQMRGWYEEFLKDQILQAAEKGNAGRYPWMTPADKAALAGVTRDSLNNPGRLSKEQRAVVERLQEQLRGRFEKRAPLSYDEHSKAGLIEDPFYSVARQIAEMGHDVATAEFFNYIAGVPDYVRDAPTLGYTEMPDTAKLGSLAGKYLRDDVAAEVQQLTELPGLGMKFYDALLGLFKTGKTVLNPGSHGRNIVGNIAFAHLAGSNPLNPGNATYYAEALRVLRDGGADYREMYESGVLGGDFLTGEVKRSLRQLVPDAATVLRDAESGNMSWLYGLKEHMARRFQGLLKKPGQGLELAATAWRLEDDIYKAAAYLKAKSMGMDSKQAAEHVREWFPYYDKGTSGTLKALGRFAFPFLSFKRESFRILKNGLTKKPLATIATLALPRLLTQIALTMGEMRLLMWTLGLGLKDERDKEDVMKALKGRAGRLLSPIAGDSSLFSILLPWRDNNGGLQQWDLSNTHPFGDWLATRIEDAESKEPWLARQAREMLTGSPFLSLLVESAMNKDSFTGRRIYEDDMSTGEASGKLVEHAFTELAPPIAPTIPLPGGVKLEGTSARTIRKAFEQSPSKLAPARNPTQALIRMLVGLDVRPADPNLYDDVAKYREKNKLPAVPRGQQFPSDAVGRARAELYRLLIQPEVDVPAVKAQLEVLTKHGAKIPSVQDLFKDRQPQDVMKLKKHQARWMNQLAPEARRVLEAAQRQQAGAKAGALDAMAKARAGGSSDHETIRQGDLESRMVRLL